MKPNMNDLTLREKIGQTVIFRHMLLANITDPDSYFSANPIGATWPMDHPREVYQSIENAYGNPDLAGPKDNMYIDYINTVNRNIRVPVIPAIDAAHGIAPSKFEGHSEFPMMAGLGATQDEDLAFRYANALGEDLHMTGFRWIWSPIADNAGCYSGTRVLSTDFENNKRLLPAFIRGMQAAGVATGAKHFPGTDPFDRRDPHFCSASYSQSFEYWQQTQGREFQVCIDAGVDSIMVGHRTFRAVDDTQVNGAYLPSTLSYKVVTELLKGKMGFEGVVLTDDSDMKALTAIYPQEKLYVELLKAGIDMVLGPHHLNYIDIVEAAVLSGELSEDRINDACRRVLNLKEKYHLFDQPPLSYPTEEQKERLHQRIRCLNQDIAAKGLTLTANRRNFLPLSPKQISKVKIIYIGYSDACYQNLKYVADEFKRHNASCDIQKGLCSADHASLYEYDLIIYATYLGFHAPAGVQAFYDKECFMMREIMTVCVEKSIGVSFGNTDIFFNYFTAAPTFINCYSYNPETMEGLVKGIYGEISFTDYSPFPLNPISRTNDVYSLNDM